MTLGNAPVYAALGMSVACVVVAMVSSLIIAWRVKYLSRNGALDAKEFLYPVTLKLRPALIFGDAHKRIGDRALSILLYIHRATYWIFGSIWACFFLSGRIYDAVKLFH